MSRLRSLSSVVGALIALTAMTAATLGLAYFISSLSSTQVNAARLASERLNEWLYMYTGVVAEGNATHVCFRDESGSVLRGAVLVEHGRVVSLEGDGEVCVPKAMLGDTEAVILASRHGALLPVPPDRVEGLEGEASLSALLSTSLETREAQSTIPLAGITWRTNVDPVNVTLLGVYAGLYEYHGLYYLLALGVELNVAGRDVRLASSYGLVRPVMPGETAARLLTGVETVQLFTSRGVQPFLSTLYSSIAMYYNATATGYHLFLADEDTLCGLLVVSQENSGGVYTSDALLACVKRWTLSGSSIVLNYTIAWLPSSSPLAQRLVSLATSGKSFTLYAGVLDTYAPTALVDRNALCCAPGWVTRQYNTLLSRISSIAKSFVSSLGLDTSKTYIVWQLPLHDPRLSVDIGESPVVPLEPLYYELQVSRRIVDYASLAYTNYYHQTVQTMPGGWSRIAARAEDTLPYLRVTATPLAMLYRAATARDLPLYVAGWAAARYEADNDKTSVYMASAYTPAALTYVDPRGAQCRLVYTGSPPVIHYLDPHSGLALIENMVCVRIGGYEANLAYALPLAELTSSTTGGLTVIASDAVRGPYYAPILETRIPGDIVACYPGAVLECSGTIHVYYTFAPSPLYNETVLNTLNSLYSNVYLQNTLLYTTHSQDTTRVYVNDATLLHQHTSLLAATCAYTRIDVDLDARTAKVTTPETSCIPAPPGIAVLEVFISKRGDWPPPDQVYSKYVLVQQGGAVLDGLYRVTAQAQLQIHTPQA